MTAAGLTEFPCQATGAFRRDRGARDSQPATIVALTAIEVPFRGALIRSQLLDPLCRVAKSSGRWRVEYLALVPWSFHFGLRHPWREFLANLGKIRKLARESSDRGIATHLWPIIFPLLPRQFNLGAGNRRLFLLCAWPVLVLFLLIQRLRGGRIGLIVARSYPAALLARLAKRFFGIPYLFDLRGMYPEECVNAGVFGLKSPDYKGWKRIERRLLAEAARCVVVSEPFAEHVRSIIAGAGPDVIPCCVDPQRYGYDPANRKRAKARHGLTGRFALLHLGSFGTPGDRGLAGRYLLRFKKAEPSAILLIASETPAFGPAIRAALLNEGLSPDDFRIYHPAPGEVAELLALGDAGLLLERKTANTKVCLSVKLGEYLASGLPVICTPHVEGAARLISEFGCGLVIDPDGGAPLDRERNFIDTIDRLRGNGLKLARSVLSLGVCAERWSKSVTAALAGQ